MECSARKLQFVGEVFYYALKAGAVVQGDGGVVTQLLPCRWWCDYSWLWVMACGGSDWRWWFKLAALNTACSKVLPFLRYRSYFLSLSTFYLLLTLFTAPNHLHRVTCSGPPHGPPV
jgi:hypothetical protein